jgi:hypothetical protein
VAPIDHRAADHLSAPDRAKDIKMKTLFYKFGFFLYKLLVRPFKRTPMQWSAIIFNKAGQFAVEQDVQGRRVASGDVIPGYPIPDLCRRALGLDHTQFAGTPPLRLIGVVGRGGEEITVYFSGEIASDSALINHLGRGVSFVERSELSSFVPAEVETNLK